MDSQLLTTDKSELFKMFDRIINVKDEQLKDKNAQLEKAIKEKEEITEAKEKLLATAFKDKETLGELKASVSASNAVITVREEQITILKETIKSKDYQLSM